MKGKKIEGFPYYICEDGTLLNKKGNAMQSNKINSGYHIYHLCNKGVRKAMLVHRIVAEYFIPNEENKEHVHHIDNNKNNNHVNNLRWVTKEENAQFAWADGLCEKVRESARARMSIIGKQYASLNSLNLMQKIPIKIVNVVTGDVYYYDSIRACAKHLGIERRNLSDSIKQKRKVKNWIAEYITIPQPNEQTTIQI